MLGATVVVFAAVGPGHGIGFQSNTLAVTLIAEINAFFDSLGCACAFPVFFLEEKGADWMRICQSWSRGTLVSTGSSMASGSLQFSAMSRFTHGKSGSRNSRYVLDAYEENREHMIASVIRTSCFGAVFWKTTKAINFHIVPEWAINS